MAFSQSSIDVIGSGLGCAAALILAWIAWETFPKSTQRERVIRRSFYAALTLLFFGFMIPATYSIHKEWGNTGVRNVLIMMGEVVLAMGAYRLYRYLTALADKNGMRASTDAEKVERTPGANLLF